MNVTIFQTWANKSVAVYVHSRRRRRFQQLQIFHHPAANSTPNLTLPRAGGVDHLTLPRMGGITLCSEQVSGGMIFALLELPEVVEDSSQPNYEDNGAPGHFTLPRVGGNALFGPQIFTSGDWPEWPIAIGFVGSQFKD